MAQRKLSQAVKKKISLAQAGKRNSMYGRKQSSRARAKISDATRGKKNPMFGKTHSAPTRQKISLMMRKLWAVRLALLKKRSS